MLLFWLWEAQLINYFTFPLNKLPFHDPEEFLSESNKKVSLQYIYIGSKIKKNPNTPMRDQMKTLFYHLS